MPITSLRQQVYFSICRLTSFSAISIGSLLAACAWPRKISEQWCYALLNHTFQDYLLGLNILSNSFMELLDPTATFALPS